MRLAIIKYNAGNVYSVTSALKRLGVDPIVTADPDLIRDADKVMFPGVGEASSAMAFLRKQGLDTIIPDLKQPFLGVCLGLQLLCRHSEENDTKCLGVFDTDVKRFPAGAKVPHIGWNDIRFGDSPLFKGLPEPAFVYFVHSYYAEPGRHSIAKTEYILPFSAALQKANFYAVQFHPEKSGRVGEQILRNFLEL